MMANTGQHFFAATAVREPQALPATERESNPRTEYFEFFVWGMAFLLFRLVVQTLSHSEHFYRDEVTFMEGALRMPASGFSSGDYIHGPVINYVLLASYSVVAAFKLLSNQIGSANDFVRWYVEQPERLGQVARMVMSFGGAALIVVTMMLARGILRSRYLARVAALILLSMPIFHNTSWYIKEDLWAAVFGTAAAVVAYRGKSAVWTGLLWGTAIAAKYTAAALGPSLLIVLMEQGESDSFPWRTWLSRCAWLGVTALGAFLALNPYTLIHFGSFLNQIALIDAQYVRGDFLGAGSRPPLLASRVFTEFLPYDIGLLAMLSMAIALVMTRLGRSRHLLPALLTSGVVIGILAISRAGFPRTLAIALPWLSVLASASYKSIAKSRFAGAAVIAALGAIAVFQTAGYYRYVTAAYTSDLARAYVEGSVSKDAVILLEDVHEYVTDAAPSLRRNVRALRAEQDDLVSRGAVGRLNQVRQAVANQKPAARFEILGIKDFSAEGRDQLDRADVVITCKWPTVFPENRQFNLPEDSRVAAVGSYNRNRQLFLDELDVRGFRLLAKFDPTLPARWSFIDRPDPHALSPMSWLGGGMIVGPEIAIYSRSSAPVGQPILEQPTR